MIPEIKSDLNHFFEAFSVRDDDAIDRSLNKFISLRDVCSVLRAFGCMVIDLDLQVRYTLY